MLDLSFESPKPKIISGAKFDWELVIGMEVHAQVASASKLFSGLLQNLAMNQIQMFHSLMQQCLECFQ